MGSKGGSSLLLSQQVCAEVCSGPDPGQSEGQAWILALQGAHGAGGTEWELPVRNQQAVLKHPGATGAQRGLYPPGWDGAGTKGFRGAGAAQTSGLFTLHPGPLWRAGAERTG